MSGNDMDTATATCSDAIRVVGYTMRLRLPPRGWERVAGLIETAIDAATAGDLGLLRQVTDELATFAPPRVIKPDGSEAVRADQKVFERANALIHALQSVQDAAARETGSGER